MSRENVIERIEVTDHLGKTHVREARTIYSYYSGRYGGMGIPNIPTPWGRIDDKGRKTCCAATRGNGWHRGSCDRPGKPHTDGRYYCGTHNPDKVKSRREERDREFHEKWDYEFRMRSKEAERRKFQCAAAEAIRKIAAGHNDSRGLAEEVLAMDPDR